MKMLDNPRFTVPPSASDLSIYPTVLDIMEEIAEEEENGIATFDPLHRTILAPMVRKGSYLLTREKDSEFAELLPTGKSTHFIYRGQSKYYAKCKPSLYRGYSEYKQMLSDLQIAELKILLNSHPILNDISKNKLYHPGIADPIRLTIYYEGLAQHYGISTNLFDFTNDKWTAAFFATTLYDSTEDSYTPITSENIEVPFGVFYMYDMFSAFERQNVKPIGLYYFNRPGAQSGFALSMSESQNLNEIGVIKKIFFRQDSDASSIVYAMNQRGKTLFPEDSLVDKVKKIKEQNVFSLAALVECRASCYPYLLDDDFNELLKKYNIQIQGGPIVSFPDAVLQNEWYAWQNGGKDRYIRSLCVIPVRSL